MVPKIPFSLISLRKQKPIFEIHVENWNSALHISNRMHWSDLKWLIDILKKYKVTPVAYILEDDRHYYSADLWDIENKFSHGVHHYYDEKADRSPYFNQEGLPGLCGGFFFRILPLWILKREIARTGLFYIHPHDLDEKHPKINNPILNWKRKVGLKNAKAKLERLLQEVKFG